MFKEVQITLYDIFGYLLPGTVILAVLLVLFWALFWPTVPLALRSDPPALVVTGLLFLAYLVGHLGQSIGNLLEKLPKSRRRLEGDLPLSPELNTLLRDAVAGRFGEKAKSLKPKELYLLCDQALIHHGSQGEREIFIYREGFYRGNCVALALFALALVLRLVRAPAVIAFAGTTLELHRSELALAALLTGLGAWLAFRRYLRFGEHRITSCFLRFLALATEPPSKKESKPA